MCSVCLQLGSTISPSEFPVPLSGASPDRPQTPPQTPKCLGILRRISKGAAKGKTKTSGCLSVCSPFPGRRVSPARPRTQGPSGSPLCSSNPVCPGPAGSPPAALLGLPLRLPRPLPALSSISSGLLIPFPAPSPLCLEVGHAPTFPTWFHVNLLCQHLPGSPNPTSALEWGFCIQRR